MGEVGQEYVRKVQIDAGYAGRRGMASNIITYPWLGRLQVLG